MMTQWHQNHIEKVSGSLANKMIQKHTKKGFLKIIIVSDNRGIAT